MPLWNPWHGCHKYSEGCQNCYVYRTDEKHGLDASIVKKTSSFDLPVKHQKNGEYKLKSDAGIIYTCFTSDFFVEDADEWRKEAFAMIKERSDLNFLFITKRIKRFYDCIPEDWGNGYDNVVICCTMENQKRADERLPFYLSLPIKHKIIICEPLLSEITFGQTLTGIEELVAGGESGNNARICDYNWILNLRKQCEDNNISFYFKQTGAHFFKDGKIYTVPRKLQHAQAQKSGINLSFSKTH